MINANISASDAGFRVNKTIGWKYYNQIKKKAMEQEFSWSGLLVSLSIAFFVVFVSSFILSKTYEVIERNQNKSSLSPQNVYILDSVDIKSLQVSDNFELSEKVKLLDLIQVV